MHVHWRRRPEQSDSLTHRPRVSHLSSLPLVILKACHLHGNLRKSSDSPPPTSLACLTLCRLPQFHSLGHIWGREGISFIHHHHHPHARPPPPACCWPPTSPSLLYSRHRGPYGGGGGEGCAALPACVTMCCSSRFPCLPGHLGSS